MNKHYSCTTSPLLLHERYPDGRHACSKVGSPVVDWSGVRDRSASDELAGGAYGATGNVYVFKFNSKTDLTVRDW